MRTVLFFLLIASLLPGSEPPWRAHGDLRVSISGRYLEHADGTPFFWIGDTAWHLQTLDRNEVDQYFRDRAAKGFNVAQIMIAKGQLNRREFGFATRDSLRGVVYQMNALGELPFETVTPLKLNEAYWAEIDNIVATAARYGIYTCFATMWGNGAAEWFADPLRGNYEYARRIAERYREAPNVIWIAAGEFVKIRRKGIRGPIDEQQKQLLSSLGRGLRAGAGKHQLIGMHGNQFEAAMPSTYFHHEDWLDFHMNQSWDRFPFIDDMINIDRAMQPPKPTFLSEGKYENSHIPGGPAAGWIANDWHMRIQAYWSVFAGGFGHTYGAYGIWNCDGKLDQRDLDLPGAAQMQHLRKVLSPNLLADRTLDMELLTSNVGTEEQLDWIIAVRDTAGERALVYDTQGEGFTLDLSGMRCSQASVAWFDPRLGIYAPLDEVTCSGTKKFDPPGRPGPGNDWALALEKLR